MSWLDTVLGWFKQEGSMNPVDKGGSPSDWTWVNPSGAYSPTDDFKSEEKLGKLSRNYEVGPRGTVGTISKGTGDPGGKSYGLWQLSSKAGTLAAFVRQSRYSSDLSKASLASPNFDRIWKNIAILDPEGFEEDQYQFIKKTHFDPVYSLWTTNLMSDSRAIREVLWSIGVQHGKAKTIVSNAITVIRGQENQSSEEVCIHYLYLARSRYVKAFLRGKLLQSLLKRYEQEERDAMKMRDI